MASPSLPLPQPSEIVQIREPVGNFEMCNLPGLVLLMTVWRNFLWIQAFGALAWKFGDGERPDVYASLRRSLVSTAPFSNVAKKLAISGS
jgi:hypothetical protein